MSTAFLDSVLGQVTFHAVRNPTRMSRGLATVWWSQVGFDPRYQRGILLTKETPRNLFGFKDGIDNLDIGDDGEMARHAWVDGADDQEWMGGGTYVVARRIRMLVEVWDRSSLRDQEQSIGRVKNSGAPVGSENEFDLVDSRPKAKTGDPGSRPIPTYASHKRWGEDPAPRLLLHRRRGPDARAARRGLFFVCFQRDPLK